MHYRSYSADDFILDEYFQQWVCEPDDESNRFWEKFLSDHPWQRAPLEQAREFLRSIDFRRDTTEEQLHRLKAEINARIDAIEAGRGESAPGREAALRAPRRYFRWLYLAAACLLFLVLLLGAIILPRQAVEGLFHGFTMEEGQTARGQKQYMVLDDGTEVWLNANSRLKYPSELAGKRVREVFLDGEAFFEVAEDPQRPFVVHTAGVSIKVLGTAFNVRSYRGDPFVETALVKGRVSIALDEDDSTEVMLLPDQLAVFNKESRKIELRSAVNSENHVAWRNGWMIFEDKPFGYIKQTLEDWYNVEIVLEDETSLSCSFSGKFKDKTLGEVLEIFRNTESIEYRIDGNQVFIKGKLCRY